MSGLEGELALLPLPCVCVRVSRWGGRSYALVHVLDGRPGGPPKALWWCGLGLCMGVYAPYGYHFRVIRTKSALRKSGSTKPFMHDRPRAEAKDAITMSCLLFVTPDKKGYDKQDLALERRFT